jgi:hypothetical protein
MTVDGLRGGQAAEGVGGNDEMANEPASQRGATGKASA